MERLRNPWLYLYINFFHVFGLFFTFFRPTIFYLNNSKKERKGWDISLYQSYKKNISVYNYFHYFYYQNKKMFFYFIIK